MPEGCRGLGGEKLYLRLKKALYGLRSAALHWAKHLAGLLERLFSLKSCPTEPCLFAGEYRGKRVLLLAYVDDILLSCEDTGLMYEMVEKLGAEVKLKVTADLARDGEITFLVRKILRSEPQGSLKFGMDPGYLVMEEYNLKGAKGCPNPPNLRDLYDRALESEELSRPLSQEASARFRRALGKMSWLATTRGDLVYFISVLARGQADPREYHERAIRGTLRYFKTVSSFFQIFPRQRDQDLRVRVFVDASWGSERSVSRRSISGGCVVLGSACVKSWARLQQLCRKAEMRPCASAFQGLCSQRDSTLSGSYV